MHGAVVSAAGALLEQLAESNHRLQFCPPSAFVADSFSSVRFQAEAAAIGLRLGVDEEDGGGAAGGSGGSGRRRQLVWLLRVAPSLVPFQVRCGLVVPLSACLALCRLLAFASCGPFSHLFYSTRV